MKELKQQLVSALLMIVSAALVVAAAINFQQQSKFHLPDDGITWLDRNTSDGEQAVAVNIVPGSPGERAGIRVGDILVSVGGYHVSRASDATQALVRLGSWHKTDY